MIKDDELSGEPVYFIFLADGNEFPKWLTCWKDGCIKIPVKQIYETVTQVHDIPLSEKERSMSTGLKTVRHECVIYKCKFKEEHVGSDNRYHFFLSEIHFTKTVTVDDIFLINIMFVAKDKLTKPSKKKHVPRVTKQVEPFSFEILCPIFQFV
jgi:hypothetical protein